MRCSCLLATILVVVSTNPVGALAVSVPQDGESGLSIVASVDRDQITVGDPFLYRITVKSPGSAAVEWPESGRPPEGFDLVSFEHAGPVTGPDGTNIDSLRYELTLYRTGEHAIPPFSLSGILSDGTELYAVSDSIPITVISVLDYDAADIRDLKSPVEIPDEIPWYWWVIGGLVLLAVAAAVILYIRRRRSQDAPTAADAGDDRSPEEIALEELDLLVRKEWLAEDRVNAHYSALSEILRRYLSARYQIAAMEYTTTELMASLNVLELGHEEIRAVRVLFEECDMVKFAKFTPESHRQSLSVPEGREIVERTRPPVVEEISGGDESPAEDMSTGTGKPSDTGDSPVDGESPDADPGSVKVPVKD